MRPQEKQRGEAPGDVDDGAFGLEDRRGGGRAPRGGEQRPGPHGDQRAEECHLAERDLDDGSEQQRSDGEREEGERRPAPGDGRVAAVGRGDHQQDEGEDPRPAPVSDARALLWRARVTARRGDGRQRLASSEQGAASQASKAANSKAPDATIVNRSLHEPSAKRGGLS